MSPLTLLKHRPTLPDGMARCAAVNLRGEAAKYVLSALGLNNSARSFAVSLQSFLRSEPTIRWTLSANRHTVRPRQTKYADIVIAEFAADGALRSLQPQLDRGDIPAPLLGQVAAELVRVYNRSRRDDDIERPSRLWDEWLTTIGHHTVWPAASHALAARYARRVLSATWLSFEVQTDRFIAPDFYRRKHGGLGALNCTARQQADGAMDLWIQVHHAAIDGGPMQEALDRLIAQWGRKSVPGFPRPGSTSHRAVAGITQGSIIERTQDFIDFTPLLECRKSLAARLDTALTGRVHLSALLIWCLARQPEFDGRIFSLAVDLPAEGRNRRAFTFLAIRPADYFIGVTGPRLSAYIREFNRLLTQTRQRKSHLYRSLSRVALLPASLRAKAIAAHPAAANTVGVSLLRNAEIFLSPMADRGFDHGVLTIGNMCLPSINGTRVGSASFAGPANRIAAYSQALQRAIEQCTTLA